MSSPHKKISSVDCITLYSHGKDLSSLRSLEMTIGLVVSYAFTKQISLTLLTA